PEGTAAVRAAGTVAATDQAPARRPGRGPRPMPQAPPVDDRHLRRQLGHGHAAVHGAGGAERVGQDAHVAVHRHGPCRPVRPFRAAGIRARGVHRVVRALTTVPCRPVSDRTASTKYGPMAVSLPGYSSTNPSVWLPPS